MRRIIAAAFIFLFSCTDNKNPFGEKSLFDPNVFIELPDGAIPANGTIILKSSEGFIFPLAFKVQDENSVKDYGQFSETTFIWRGDISYFQNSFGFKEFFSTHHQELAGGIYRLGNVSMSSISAVSDKLCTYTNYGTLRYFYKISETVITNETYAIVTAGGYYAKMKVIKIENDCITIEWAFQPNGTRYF